MMFDLDTPYALTHKDWLVWEAKTKAERPVSWFVRRTVPDFFWEHVGSHWENLSSYVYNRRRSSHLLVTSLKPGVYYGFDTKILDAAFSTLVDYVECDLATRLCCWDSEKAKRYGFDKHQYGKFRNPEAGIAHLDWECTLTNSYDGNDPDVELSTQAISAKEVLELYKWWKHVRPSRVDPGEASGWNKFHVEHSDTMFDIEEPEVREQCHAILDNMRELERIQYDEDTVMLVRLVKIRENIWV